MTRKDYQLIAQAIKDCATFPYETTVLKTDLVDALSILLRKDNPRFNEEAFVKACGIE